MKVKTESTLKGAKREAGRQKTRRLDSPKKRKRRVKGQIRDVAEVLDGVDVSIFESELDEASELTPSEYHAILETTQISPELPEGEEYHPPIALFEEGTEEERFEIGETTPISLDGTGMSRDREKVRRRRQIDPTTCERDYSPDEIEFMNALDHYKRANGRMFPTCSEILEVLLSLGYVKRTAEESVLPTHTDPEAVTGPATPAFSDDSNEPTDNTRYQPCCIDHRNVDAWREPLLLY